MVQPSADRPRDASEASEASDAGERRTLPNDRFSLLFRSAPLPLALVDEDGSILDANAALTQLLGRSVVELRGTPMIDLTHPADRSRVREAVTEVTEGERDSVQMRKRMRVDSGPGTPVRVTLLRLDEPSGVHHRLAQIEDLSTDGREQLFREANEDHLTGVANRRALERRLDPLINGTGASAARAEPVGWSVLFVDLNNFKQVNDEFGHVVGDAVLVTVASRLSRLTREADMVCRLGGDEFVVLLGTAATDEVELAAARIRRSLAQPVVVGEAEVRISASVGSATPKREETTQDLLARADAAMYRDKSAKRVDQSSRPGG